MRTAVVALGSNFGDRLGFLSRAWRLVRDRLGGPITGSSKLYDTAPQLVTDQPRFLNAVMTVETALSPLDALRELKHIEAHLGRQDRGRYGPREIDLDLLFVDDLTVEVDVLSLPHPRIAEREFVLRPLADVAKQLATPPRRLLDALASPMQDTGDLVRVWAGLPLGRQTQIMGILNCTPDSFSDGGDLTSPRLYAQLLVEQGASMLDVGGESTRPGASQPTEEQELERVVPVIQAIKDLGVPISIDTRRASVARAALDAGATIVNDVSGGTYDAAMLPLLVEYPGSSAVLMHMRGTPGTMQKKTDYGAGVVEGVKIELEARLRDATEAGVAPWRVALDPGIGFAKNGAQNIELMRNLPRFCAINPSSPILVGPSRKSFIGSLVNEADPKDRDWGTAGACCASVPHADILRVHNVKALKQALTLADTILR